MPHLMASGVLAPTYKANRGFRPELVGSSSARDADQRIADDPFRRIAPFRGGLSQAVEADLALRWKGSASEMTMTTENSIPTRQPAPWNRGRLIGIPVNNFCVPSMLKPWIDHIVSISRRFRSREVKTGLLNNGSLSLARMAACEESGDADQFSDALLAGNFRDDRHPFARIRPRRRHRARRRGGSARARHRGRLDRVAAAPTARRPLIVGRAQLFLFFSPRLGARQRGARSVFETRATILRRVDGVGAQRRSVMLTPARAAEKLAR
jgi:hypothetical protein